MIYFMFPFRESGRKMMDCLITLNEPNLGIHHFLFLHTLIVMVRSDEDDRKSQKDPTIRSARGVFSL